MTAILALLQRDSSPVDPSVVARMQAAARYRGHDGEDAWISGPIALSHQHCWTLPAEIGERQPLYDTEARCAITCDARLDNRTTLLQALGIDHADGELLSDAATILLAYRQWGATCPEHLEGAFVFAVWDERAQHLFIARDPLGERAAVYYDDGQAFLVASEIAPLLAHPAVSAVLNEGAVAEYLEGVWAFEHETYYQGILSCRPAHCMLVTADAIRTWRYWDIDPEKRIRYRRREEYVEHFRTLFTDAVRHRLRSTGQVGIMLSGGLDSTSIAAVAAKLLGEKRLKSFSYTFDELTSCDERAYILPVIERSGLDATFIPGDDKWALRDLPHWLVQRDYPAQDVGAWLTTAILQEAQTQGCRVMMTGLGGDELFHGGVYWAVGAMSDRSVFSMLPDLMRHRSKIDWRNDVLRRGVRQNIPQRWRRAYRHRRPKPLKWTIPGLHPDLIAHSSLEERSVKERFNLRYNGPAQWLRYLILLDRANSESNAGLRRQSLGYGIEFTNPFSDRALIEFALAVPAYELALPYRKKRLLRDAMEGTLPDSVRERIGKTSTVPLSNRGLLERERDTVCTILRDPQIVRRRYIREDWLRQELDAGPDWSYDGYLLWLCLSLELWLNRYW